MRLRSVLARATLLAAVVGATVVTAVSAPVGTVSAAGATSAYVAMPVSQRLVDTRLTTALAPGGSLSVSVTGAAPLPATGTVTAAVLNLTVTAPFGAGFFTVWPHTSARPEASNLNIDELQSLAGGAVPNLVTVPVGADGVVDVYSSAGGNVIVDLLGYYTAADTATAGRFEALAAPTRVMDTRRVATFAPGETRAFTIPGAAGANAVAVNLTSLTTTPGYWQVYPTGGAAPATSNLNSPAGFNAVVANQAIVTVDAGGSINIFSEQGGDLLIDLVGTYTGAGAPASTIGLFVPTTSPTRIVDTRSAALNPLGGATRPEPASTFEVPVSTNPAIGRPDVSAVVLNATSAGTLTTGFVTVGTAGATAPGARPSTSTMNVVRPAQILANHAIVPVSTRGFSMFTEAGGDMIADLAGYFLGSPSAAPFGVPVKAPSPGCATPRVGYASAPVGPIVFGSSRSAVATLQGRLLALGFWNGGADGGYGLTTVQAVMAFQKWRGLPATTVVDVVTATALNLQVCRPGAATTTGTLLEVDKGKQIAYVVQNGQTRYIFNVSTGNGESYDEEDQKNAGARSIGIALTPTGTFRTYRETDDPRYESDLGTLYRPKFVVGGIAVHGARSVPNFPASHGCIRVANPVMDLIWGENLLPLRSTVVIRD
ncbi:MAG TPA: peptidoglycan-binding protein [Ilumatobacteraceae bacterium]|nr:peptidoglycan-binding protein [Ilumatobacteraceae bacterium]